MLTREQEKLLRELQTKKGRRERGMFVVEGEKFVRDAGASVVFSFTPNDTDRFADFVSTVTPQTIAAVAKAPVWTLHDVAEKKIIVVLDGVQDPGNVGTIVRACLGFDTGLLLVESAEMTNPKTVRSSASAMLSVPFVVVSRAEAPTVIASLHRNVYRLEVNAPSVAPNEMAHAPCVILAGSEGQGIRLDVAGTTVTIPHNPALESLNVAVAVSIALYALSPKSR